MCHIVRCNSARTLDATHKTKNRTSTRYSPSVPELSGLVRAFFRAVGTDSKFRVVQYLVLLGYNHESEEPYRVVSSASLRECAAGISTCMLIGTETLN